MGRSEKMIVYGPPGTKAVLNGFAEIYREDIEDRVARRGKDDLNSSLALAESHIVTVNDKEAQDETSQPFSKLWQVCLQLP
jgi:hypothetical protein